MIGLIWSLIWYMIYGLSSRSYHNIYHSYDIKIYQVYIQTILNILFNWPFSWGLPYPLYQHSPLTAPRSRSAPASGRIGAPKSGCGSPAAPVIADLSWCHWGWCEMIDESGWWFQHLWKILVNWDAYSQYMEKTVPNHQPVNDWWIIDVILMYGWWSLLGWLLGWH